MRTSRSLVLALSIVGALPTAAAADSDGHYCKGPDYLAYHFGMIDVKNPVELFVIRIGSIQPASIKLSAFQVHGIRCAQNSVELLGRTTTFDGLYTITLDDDRRPIRYETVAHSRYLPKPTGFAPMMGSVKSLNPTTALMKPDIEMVGIDGRGYRYTLEMVPRPVSRCAAHLTSRFVERSPEGRETRAYVIFRDTISRECAHPETER